MPDILYPFDREYPVTSTFGPRVDPLGRGAGFHGGVDLGAPTGTPLYAVASGRIFQSWDPGGGGNWTRLVADDGNVYGYGHQSAFVADPDGHVDAGQLIGYVGSTGASTGAHLHFAYGPGGGAYADGLPLLRAAAAAGRFPGAIPIVPPDKDVDDMTADECRQIVQQELANKDARDKAILGSAIDALLLQLDPQGVAAGKPGQSQPYVRQLIEQIHNKVGA